MTTLQQLESVLQGLDAGFPSAKLEGLAFKLTRNESLGLNDNKPFNVNIPFRTWPDKVGDKLPECKYPSALQEAFMDVLAAGSKKPDGSWDTTTCWIDIVSLNPADLFFTENSKNSKFVPISQLDSVAKAIADVVNSIPESSNITPIIRILAGADEAKTAGKYWTDYQYRYENMFWVQEKEGGEKVPLITQKNAKLFVGYYGPNFHTGSQEATSWLQSLGASVDSIAQKNEALIKSYATNSSFDPKKLHLSDTITNFVKKDLPAISWNHGKLLVVNGKVVMTGGGNYWNQYMGKEHDILDHQVKIKGDAAITGHEYTSYFFKYLNKLADIKSDTRSLLRSCTFSDSKPNWSDNTTAPIASFNPANTGKFPVLTIGRLGDWHGSMAKVPFPVQVGDAIRDIALNVLWHIQPDNEQGKTLAKIDLVLRDDSNLASLAKLADALKNIGSGGKGQTAIAVPDIHQIFTDLQINPVAWASRFARKYVIENAEKRVCISQQMLVDTLQLGDQAYKDAVFGVKNRPGTEDSLGINGRVAPITKGSKPWDGALWPYDLLYAIGWALSRIDYNNGDGVYIVLTTSFPPDGMMVQTPQGEVFKKAKQRDWEDKTSVAEFKRRLAICMKGMAQLRFEIPTWFLWMVAENRVDEVIRNRLKIKRVLKNDGEEYCHNKIVMVDDKLMYVGSDNAYPCYNEEHGVWIDHQDTIKSWKKNYWDGLWAWSTDATD